MKRQSFLCLVLLALSVFHASSGIAGMGRVVADNDTVILHGNTHAQARPEFDMGKTDLSLSMERMVLVLKMAPESKAELDRLMAEQQDPASANYHRWLTPEQFGERFGPKQEDISTVTSWLAARGFVNVEVAKGGGWINFSGSVAQVNSAFHTEIHNYLDLGKVRHANSRDPSMPRALADLVGGPVSLHNFPRLPMNTGFGKLVSAGPLPQYTSGSHHYLSPADFATIYNLNPLYNAGIDGSGQSIAIVGRTHPPSANWSGFRAQMGLPVNTPLVIVNGTDPGDLGPGEDGEADLDVEWSGAVAKNALIKFVVSKSTSSTDGVDLSAQYIVNNNIAPVMSTSFGSCESKVGQTERSFFNNLWQQAAAQGITSFVASGDAGAAGCNNPGDETIGSGTAVSGLASTPFNVAVGGTQFHEGLDIYWNANNSTWFASAIGYIPETAWNESGSVSGGSGLWSTGGGASLFYSKPSWQVCPGVPADGSRDLPDVSLSAAGHDGYLVQSQGALLMAGGTSAASPAFAGLMALVVQKTGQRQGNANVRFYQLASAQYGSGGSATFHDVLSGNNSVPGVTGYSCAAGYDLATGLGSVDATALVNNWATQVSSYTLSYSAGANGTVSGLMRQTVIPGGSGSQVTAVANPGYHFVSWSDAVTTAARTDANVTANISVIASFAINAGSSPSGDINGDGVVDVSDALLALRIAVQLIPPDPKYFTGGDVAPLVNGSPQPNGIIDVADALLILRKCVGLVNW